MSLNGFRSRVASFILGKNKEGKPVVVSEHGVTTEAMRLQGAMNMKLHPEIKSRVEMHFIMKAGGNVARGIIACRRQFPEAYED